MYKQRKKESAVWSYLCESALILFLILLSSPVWVEGGTVSVCTPPPSGMVSWWSADNNTLDMAGNNHGTLMGGATYAPGMVGQAFSFDGSGDYVSVPVANNLALNRPLTPLTNNVMGDPSYAVDGSFSNYWYSYQSCGGVNRSSFSLDLGDIKTVGQLYFQPLQTFSYTIWTSDDGSTWTQRHTDSTPAAWTTPISISVNGAYAARYIKYEGANYAGCCCYAGIAEFQVFESIPDPTNITVDAWVKPASYQTTASIINKRTTANTEGYTLEDNGNNGINFFVWLNGSWHVAVSNVPLPLNIWTHVAGTYDGNMIRVYFNGQEVGTTSVVGSMTPAAAELQIGRNIAGGATWNGLIDEVEIFDRALSGSEIAAIYNAGSAGKCRSCVPPPSEIVAWWRAEDNAFDSFDGNNGTMTNGATFANGKIGRAFSFDGVNDYISISDSPQFNIGAGDFSLSLWANYSAVRSGGAGSLPNVFLGQDEGGGTTDKWVFYSTDTGLWFHINGPASRLIGPAAFTPQAGRWYQISLIRSGSVYAYYVDGVKIGEVTDSTTIPDVSAPLTIGQAEGLGFFNGLMDEITVFNRALTADEIAAIYNAGSAGQCSQQQEQFALTVTKAGTGKGTVTASGITCGTDCSESLDEGTVVTLTATPVTGSIFTGWSGDPDCFDGRVTMNADKTCTATFKLAPDLVGSWTWTRKSGPDRRGNYKFSGSLNVSNIGPASANNAVVNVYLSDNSTYEPGDTLIASLSYGTIGTKITKGKSFNLTTRKNPTGKYVIGVIDPSNIVTESNEANNSALKLVP